MAVSGQYTAVLQFVMKEREKCRILNTILTWQFREDFETFIFILVGEKKH